MENQNMIYNDFELEEIKNLKTVERIKQKRNAHFFILLINFCLLFFSIYNLVTNFRHKQWDFIILFILLSILLILFTLICIIQVSVYHILIIKYNKVNDPKSNPLANVCKEKVENCKSLINNKENYYLVKKHYIDLRDFLNKYKYLLPVETYIKANEDLEFISSEMLNCDLK